MGTLTHKLKRNLQSNIFDATLIATKKTGTPKMVGSLREVEREYSGHIVKETPSAFK